MRRGLIIGGIAILIIAIGVVLIQKHLNLAMQHENEAELRRQLASMRHAIAAFRAKHHHGPASLDDLVPDELRVVPVDPITHSSTPWKTTVEERVRIDDFQPGSAKSAPSVVDVHSGASGSDSAGRPFADY